MAKVRPDKAKAMKAKTASEFAEIIGKDPKAFRAFLRRNGIRVSETDFDAKAKNLGWQQFVEGKNVSKADKTKATRTSGGNSKDRRTRARKKAQEEAAPEPALAE